MGCKCRTDRGWVLGIEKDKRRTVYTDLSHYPACWGGWLLCTCHVVDKQERKDLLDLGVQDMHFYLYPPYVSAIHPTRAKICIQP
jgi:hypothetical protein